MKRHDQEGFKLYFSYGMTKCGSTLAFSMMRSLLIASGYPQERLPNEVLGERPVINFVNPLTEDQLRITLDIVEETGNPLVLKTHSKPSAPMIKLLEDGTAIGHAVFRDPREMALSMVDHGQRSREKGVAAFSEYFEINDAIDNITSQIQTFVAWVDCPGIRPWYYDDFAWNMGKYIDELRRQTGLSATTKEAREELNPKRGTQYNKAQRNRWREDMSQEDSEFILDKFADFYAERIEKRSVVGTSHWASKLLPDRGIR